MSSVQRRVLLEKSQMQMKPLKSLVQARTCGPVAAAPAAADDDELEELELELELELHQAAD